MSNQLSYIATVNSNLTLYAKGEKIVYNINVGSTEHGSATVSQSTAYYGDTVTFNCVVDDGCEFKGWYSDEGLTQLVSENVKYVHNVTGNITLWAKVEKIGAETSLIIHPTAYTQINGDYYEEAKPIFNNFEYLYNNDLNSTNYATINMPKRARR